MSKHKNILYFMLLVSCFAIAQDELQKEKNKALKESTNLIWEGNKNISEDKFIEAEVDYRKAISESSDNAVAPYNLGNAYYNKETYNEAFGRFKEASETSTSKEDKHMAYHNMGNVFMKRKDYAKAVEAYKQALRNNPKDEETRYNLALAKEMMKNDDQNKDQNDKNDENKDKDNKEENKDNKEEGDNKDDKDQKDKGDEGDQDKENKDENKDGKGDEKKDQQKKPEPGEGEQQQPKPNQLSKQQVENLLRAMENAEKKVQEKMDAKKVQGAKVKTEKDW